MATYTPTQLDLHTVLTGIADDFEMALQNNDRGIMLLVIARTRRLAALYNSK